MSDNGKQNPASPRVRWYHLFIPAAAVVLPLLLWRMADSPAHAVRWNGETWSGDSNAYASSESCRACHAAIVEEQLASNHARTVRDLSREAPLAPFDTGQPVLDPLTGARYVMNRSKRKRPQIELTIGNDSVRQELAYEFGSGAHAMGYLTRVDAGEWVDARLNYYTEIHGWDFTSSQDKPSAYLTKQPLGRPQTEAKAGECFSCHSTVVRVSGKGVTPDGRQVRLRPEHSALGVTCESCHGPRAAHVKQMRAGTKSEPAPRLTADEINAICGRCHGLTNVNPAHPVIARFQPWGLSQSRCFRESAGRLTCLTCHDPHQNAARDASFYEAKCLSCHSGGASPAKTVCPVNPKAGCIPCHMPEDSHSMLHIRFYDHRIRVPKGGERAAGAARS